MWQCVRSNFIAPKLWLPLSRRWYWDWAWRFGRLLVRTITWRATGILGVTLLWDSFEFWRQQKRVIKGHAPANPDNPRHARILAENPSLPPSTCSTGIRSVAGQAKKPPTDHWRISNESFGLIHRYCYPLHHRSGFRLGDSRRTLLWYLWWPYFMGLGILLVIGSIFIPSTWGSALWVFSAPPSFGVRPNSRNRPSGLNWAGISIQNRNLEPPFAEIIKKWQAPHL